MVSHGLAFSLDALVAVLIVLTASLYLLNAGSQLLETKVLVAKRTVILEKLFFASEALLTTPALAVVEENAVKHHVLNASRAGMPRLPQGIQAKIYARNKLFLNQSSTENLSIKRIALCDDGFSRDLCVVELQWAGG